MRRVAIIKDLFRNVPHVVISENNGAIEAKGLTEYGNQIIATSNISSHIEQIALPEGFVCTGFKTITPVMEKMLSNADNNSIEVKSLSGHAPSTSRPSLARTLLDRRINQKDVNTVVSAGISINRFSSIAAKMNAIDYKARQFQITSKFSAIVTPIKSGKFGFDTEKSSFVSRKDNPLSIFAIEVAEKAMPESVMARFLADDGKRGKTKRNRRANRRAMNLSPVVDGIKKPSGNKRITLAIKSRLR